VTSLADHLHELTLAALDECTERQRRAYQLVHGITGTGLHAEPCTITEAARIIAAPRQNVTNDLAHARAAVYERIAKHLIVRFTLLEQETEIEVPGVVTSIVAHEEARYFMHVGERTEQRIDLGPGSSAMESAAKRGASRTTGMDRATLTVRAHERHTRAPRTERYG
jgi:hypothetical protein